MSICYSLRLCCLSPPQLLLLLHTPTPDCKKGKKERLAPINFLAIFHHIRQDRATTIYAQNVFYKQNANVTFTNWHRKQQQFIATSGFNTHTYTIQLDCWCLFHFMALMAIQLKISSENVCVDLSSEIRSLLRTEFDSVLVVFGFNHFGLFY